MTQQRAWKSTVTRKWKAKEAQRMRSGKQLNKAEAELREKVKAGEPGEQRNAEEV